jgi:uncharacterized protein YbjT (DUF2867 family)
MSSVLIIGGSGKTGSRVHDRLRALGHDVRAVSRSSRPGFDWDNKLTWAPALAGMDSAYVTYAPDIALPGALARVTALFELAC